MQPIWDKYDACEHKQVLPVSVSAAECSYTHACDHILLAS